MQRKTPLVNGQTYHVTSKSIAGYRIFNSDSEYTRMIQMIRFFAYAHNLPKFSDFIETRDVRRMGFEESLSQSVDDAMKLVRIIAYCIMPTHIHLLLEQKKENGISTAVGNILNAFARFFNIKHNRQGPLWMSRFKGIHVASDEQLLHLTRYIHLNPVSAGLVKNAALWEYSSYSEYVDRESVKYPFCDLNGRIRYSSESYQKFVDDHAGYQRQLAIIKHHIDEDR